MEIRLKKCCCCSLRTGILIYTTVTGVSAVLLFIWKTFVYRENNAIPNCKSEAENTTYCLCPEDFKRIQYQENALFEHQSKVADYFALILKTVVLIYGVIKGKTEIIFAYGFVEAVGIISVTVLLAFQVYYAPVLAFLAFIIIGVELLIHLYIHSYYLDLKDRDKARQELWLEDTAELR